MYLLFFLQNTCTGRATAEGRAVVAVGDKLISLFHCHPLDDELFAAGQRTFTESRVQNERLNCNGCDARSVVHVDSRGSALIACILHSDAIGGAV